MSDSQPSQRCCQNRADRQTDSGQLDRSGGDRDRSLAGNRQAIALVLAAAGAKVACVARSRENLTETAEAIRAAGGTAEVMACDVAERRRAWKKWSKR